MKQHVVQLKTPIEYSAKGEIETAHEITLSPPVFKTMKKAARVAQFFLRAAKEAQEASGLTPEEVQLLAAEQEALKAAGKEEDTSAEEMQVLIMSSSQDLDPLYDAFKGIMESSAYLDDGILMKETLIERMDVDDFNKLLFEYIARFTVPSLS